MSGDIGIILGEFMDDAAVRWAEVYRHRLSGAADFINPTFGLSSDAVRTGTLIITNVDIDTSTNVF